MVPHRPPGPSPRKSGPIPYPGPAASFDAVKARVLAKLEDRMDLGASKRMPSSLLRQSLRTLAEQIADQEGRGMGRADRDRLVEGVLAELLGYGPLEELFRDPAVLEVLVAGPHAVIVRREHGGWAPTSVRFKDEDHLRTAIDRLATHADPVGGVTTSVNLFDLKLPNGFRAVGVVPPPALGVSASVAFVRFDANAPQPTALAGLPGVEARPAQPAGGSASVATRATPGSPLASPRPGSGPITTPAPRPILSEGDPLFRLRNRIIERLITKLANLGVYDLHKIDGGELRRAVAAYVAEYVAAENIYLSETDQARLQLEILTAMRR
jgi:hypothetical protein